MPNYNNLFVLKDTLNQIFLYFYKIIIKLVGNVNILINPDVLIKNGKTTKSKFSTR